MQVLCRQDTRERHASFPACYMANLPYSHHSEITPAPRFGCVLAGCPERVQGFPIAAHRERDCRPKGGQKADKILGHRELTVESAVVNAANEGTAKPLYVGSIPTRPSKSTQPNWFAVPQIYIPVSRCLSRFRDTVFTSRISGFCRIAINPGGC